MAYSHPTLHRIGPSNSSVPTLWSYSTADAKATVDSRDYFNLAVDDLTVGDFIFAKTSDDSCVFVVTEVDATVGAVHVDVNDAVTLKGADTD